MTPSSRRVASRFGPGPDVRPALHPAARRLREKAGRLLFREDWCVAYLRRTCGATPPGTRPTEFTGVRSPAGRFWADPFPIEHEGTGYVFVEEFVNRRGKAHIAVAQVENGVWKSPRKVLERDYHLSY